MVDRSDQTRLEFFFFLFLFRLTRLSCACIFKISDEGRLFGSFLNAAPCVVSCGLTVTFGDYEIISLPERQPART